MFSEVKPVEIISVIIPVYRTELYLDKCISSVVNQTYTDLEIILVDDGSPDACPAICDAWAAMDKRIRVIHQKNGGGGAARNTGLDAANGELVAFVDSDDYLSPDMYAHLYRLLESGADVAECDYVEVTDDAAEFTKEFDVHLYTTKDAMAEHIQNRIFRQLIWNKLYRRRVVDNTRFPVNKAIDDEFFTYQVLGKSRTLIHSSRICYAYRQQPGSVMHSMSISKRLQAVEAKIQRHEYIQRRFPELDALSACDLWFTCIYQGQLAIRGLDAADAKRVLGYLEGVLQKYPVQPGAYRIKGRIWSDMARGSIATTCRVRNMLKIGL